MLRGDFEAEVNLALDLPLLLRAIEIYQRYRLAFAESFI